MKKLELRRIGILKRVFNNPVATSFAKAFRSIYRQPLEESNSRVYSEELTEPYIPYDELKRVRLQLFELERQRAEATNLVRQARTLA